MIDVSGVELSGHFLEIDTYAATLETWWDELLSDLPKPPLGQFVLWAKLHHGSMTAMRFAFERAQARNHFRRFNDAQHPIRWISSTANNYVPVILRKKYVTSAPETGRTR